MTTDHGQSEIDAMTDRLQALDFPTSMGAFCASQADRFGDKTAIDYFQHNVQLSYRDVHKRSNRVAASLLGRGYRKGTHIAVMLPNGPASAVVWFAIMKIGAVLVPVNTAYGGKELDYLLNQSDAQALIMSDEYVPALDAMTARPELLAAPIMVSDTELGPLEVGGPLEHFHPGYEVHASNLANLQYTSGTTGSPKGCMLTQDYWLLLAYSIGEVHRSYGNSRLFYWAPFFYMDGQWSFLSAMAIGGTAIVASKMSLTNFLDWLHEHDAHYCVLPEPILKTVPPSTKDANIPLKFVHTFGWRPAARAQAEARFDLVARDSFGMTEVGPAIVCPRDAGTKLDLNTCGLAAPFRETRVVDDDGNECSPGLAGELQIRGRSIMLGYYKRPDANVATFDGDWLRTGDLFIKDDDGYHRIVGRIKEMIKRAGENISASEVEAAMREAPAVSEAAAVAVPDDMRREEVLVLLKLADGYGPGDMSPEAVRAHSSMLAAFKRPRYVAYVDEFPRTATNKIAKSALGIEHLTSAIVDLQENSEVTQDDAARLLKG